jgi:DNA ligase-associated metallophosphoesterase
VKLDPLYLTRGGRRLGLCASGALYLPDDETLIVADLHLEKGSSYAARGQLLPPYDTAATLTRLEAEVDRLRPGTVLLLGDSFHDARSLERLAGADADRLDALASRTRLVFIVGNHDAEALVETPGESLSEWRLEGLVLRHEAEYALDEETLEISGHYHPCAKVAAAGRAVRRRCFVTDGRRLILPAFGAYAGGLNVLDPAFAAFLVNGVRVFALAPGGVVALAGNSLRPD